MQKLNLEWRMLKKSVLALLITLISIPVTAKEFEPSKVPTIQSGPYCPKPYGLRKVCIKCETAIKGRAVVKVCLKWKLICDNEEFEMESPKDCGYQKFIDSLTPKQKNELIWRAPYCPYSSDNKKKP